MLLRAATLNVWALPEPFGEAVDARMQAIVSSLPALEIDVLGLQEVWLAHARNRLIDGARRAGLVHAWSSDTDGWNAGGGLVLLSRHPMHDVRFESYRLRGDVERLDQGEYLGGKGYLSAVLESEHGPVQFVNTHLHARYRNAAAHEYRPHRTAQLVQLATQGLDSKLPVVLMGDFNFSDRGPEYRIARDLVGLSDSPAELGMREPTVYAANPYRSSKPQRPQDLERRDRRKDFIFRRDGARLELRPVRAERIFDEAIQLGGRPAAYSNHAGVMVDFEVAPTLHRGLRAPDHDVIALAAELLESGRRAALERAADQEAWALTGAGIAIGAVGAAHSAPFSRRRFLRGVLHAAASIAAFPGLGMALTSCWVLPREVAAFDEATRMLAHVGSSSGEVSATHLDDGTAGA
jgi:endonuclease/exonuclease/phosphatase family metal-dependent hydrolase